MDRLRDRYGHSASYGFQGPGTRTYEERLEHASRATVPAPRMTEREMLEQDRRMRELLLAEQEALIDAERGRER